MVVWFRKLLKNFKELVEPTLMHEDNSSCFSLDKGEGRFLTSKNIGVRYHYLGNKVKAGETKLGYVPTEDQIGDFLNKAFTPRRFDKLVKKILSSDKSEDCSCDKVCK